LRSNEKCCSQDGEAASLVHPRMVVRTVPFLLSMMAAVVLAGCGAMSGKSGVTDKQALQERVDERMAAADKALKQGQTDQALAQLDGAIQVDPAAKQPWLKKAQIHFEARQYGQAITEAQEVLQRDVRDLTAQSILAVSGLRVSAQALEQLRKVNEVNGSTRSEAESVARLIHEALGEPILLSTAAAASSPSQASASTPTSAASARARATASRPSRTGSATNSCARSRSQNSFRLSSLSSTTSTRFATWVTDPFQSADDRQCAVAIQTPPMRNCWGFRRWPGRSANRRVPIA